MKVSKCLTYTWAVSWAMMNDAASPKSSLTLQPNGTSLAHRVFDTASPENRDWNNIIRKDINTSALLLSVVWRCQIRHFSRCFRHQTSGSRCTRKCLFICLLTYLLPYYARLRIVICFKQDRCFRYHYHNH